MRKHFFAAALLCSTFAWGQAWTLDRCIEHARTHNIAVLKSEVAQDQGEATQRQNKAALWPTLSASMSQSIGYRPFQEDVASMVQGGMATSTSNKVTENGSYGLNAQWTVFNGLSRVKTIKAQEITNEINALSTERQILSVEEQIAQLYVQILYSTEAVKVNEQLLETARRQHERGVEMVEAGQFARADLAQLEAQLSAAQYDVVSSRTQVAGFKRQLKQLLQIEATTPFDVETIEVSDEAALGLLPSLEAVYESALAQRPEIRSAQRSVDVADVNIDVARAGYWPTISLNAGIGNSHYSASPKPVGNQMKQNLNGSLGVTVSVPIFDNRRNRTNVEKAQLNKTSASLDLADARQALSSTIENYWLEATNNQQKFIAAQSRVKSQMTSYELLDEQFKAGLKNIVELLQGHDQVVSAQQDRLQSKYSAVLSLAMLRFYQNGELRIGN